jgi:putative FmdB family regulatory protein
MPIYEYKCQSCGHEFEELVSVGGPAPACPTCQSTTDRLLSQIGGTKFRPKEGKKAHEHEAKRINAKRAAEKARQGS